MLSIEVFLVDCDQKLLKTHVLDLIPGNGAIWYIDARYFIDLSGLGLSLCHSSIEQPIFKFFLSLYDHLLKPLSDSVTDAF
jgi:hypothetical protein